MPKPKKNPSEKLTVTAFSLRPSDLYHLERMAKENKSRFIRILIEDEWQRQSRKEQHGTAINDRDVEADGAADPGVRYSNPRVSGN